MVVGNLDYDSNINPQYNTIAIYESIQSAIKSFIDRFISVSPFPHPHPQLPTTSSSLSALKFAQSKNAKGISISFSFAASPAWVSSQQTVLSGSLPPSPSPLDLNGKRLNTNVFSQLADPDPLYLCPIYFYVKSFILQSTLLANRSPSRLD